MDTSPDLARPRPSSPHLTKCPPDVFRQHRPVTHPRTGGRTRKADHPVLRWKAMPAPPPVIAYPPELPVSAAREEIARAIRGSQVVIVAGVTGSGKTTQLPKICLE